MKKFRSILAALAVVMAFGAFSASAMAENPPSPDQINQSNWNVAVGVCGQVHPFQWCTIGNYDYLVYNAGTPSNPSHYYVVSVYIEGASWGRQFQYCALSSWWRGYYHLDVADWRNSTWCRNGGAPF